LKEKVAISWSGGKDCTLALHKILESRQFDACSLHTTFNEDTKRVGLHGIRQSLIEQQAESLGITLDKILISSSEDHLSYETAMRDYYKNLATKGVKKVMFGDIFLEDLKAYREKMLEAYGMEGIFPLWKSRSRSVAIQFIEAGFKGLVCSANSNYFDRQIVGNNYDLNFINSLPAEVDPCGENGEFHTFVYDGPIFKKRITVKRKQVEAKEYTYKITLPNGESESRLSKFWFKELE
jgi:uncharacterized protein (TIGR00290 family)